MSGRTMTGRWPDGARHSGLKMYRDINHKTAPEFLQPRLHLPVPPRIQWHAIGVPSRDRVYRRYGLVDAHLPEQMSRNTTAAAAAHTPRTWRVGESVTKVDEIVLDRNQPHRPSPAQAKNHGADSVPSAPGSWRQGSAEGDLLLAHSMLNGEIEKMAGEENETTIRTEQAAAFTPGYYGDLLTGAINHAIMPAATAAATPVASARQPTPADSVGSTSDSSVGPGLGFGSPQYRSHVRQQIEHSKRYGRVLTRQESKQAEAATAKRALQQPPLPRPPKTPPPLKISELGQFRIRGLIELAPAGDDKCANAERSWEYMEATSTDAMLAAMDLTKCHVSLPRLVSRVRALEAEGQLQRSVTAVVDFRYDPMMSDPFRFDR